MSVQAINIKQHNAINMMDMPEKIEYTSTTLKELLAVYQTSCSRGNPFRPQ